MQYSWKIINATIKDTDSINKVVVNCAWRKTGEDLNGNTGSYYGNTQFELSSIDTNAFIPFENLTEDIMLSWVQSKISEQADAEINNSILSDLEKKKYPETTVAPPWEI